MDRCILGGNVPPVVAKNAVLRLILGAEQIGEAVRGTLAAVAEGAENGDSPLTSVGQTRRYNFSEEERLCARLVAMRAALALACIQAYRTTIEHELDPTLAARIVRQGLAVKALAGTVPPPPPNRGGTGIYNSLGHLTAVFCEVLGGFRGVGYGETNDHWSQCCVFPVAAQRQVARGLALLSPMSLKRRPESWALRDQLTCDWDEAELDRLVGPLIDGRAGR